MPHLFTQFDDWVKTQPADRDPMHPDITGLEIVSVAMQPGDLLLFNSLLAHGVRPNRSTDRVRMAQYISMHPAEPDNPAERDERIGCGASRIFRNARRFPAIRGRGSGGMRRWRS